MKYVFAFLLFLTASNSAIADEYGPFICTTGCTFAGPVNALPDGTTQGFIEAVVNEYDDGDYQMNDTVVICNGNICGTYRRVMFGFALVNRAPDTGGPYLNTAQGNTDLGGGGGAFNGGGTVRGGYGIIGFRAVTRTGQTCTEGVCSTTTIVVYEPIYGYYTTMEP
jgi:hypothetical protein